MAESGAGSGGAGNQNNAGGAETPPPPPVNPPNQTEAPPKNDDVTTTQPGKPGEEGGKQDPKEAETKEKEKGGESKDQETTPSDYDVKLPAGVEADPEMLGAFKAMAKEAKLSGENAQKIVDIYAAAHQSAQRKATESWAAEQAAWVKSIHDDKELGGHNLKTSEVTTQRAMRAFATPELNKFLLDTGLGNHPEMVRLFYRVGKTLKEDSIAGTSTQGGSGKLSEEEKALRRYPTMRNV